MEAVGQLAGGIAHDFNNLLTGILSYCDLLLDEVRSGDPIRSDVEQIRQAGQRAAGLTRQLLAFSRRQVLQPKVLSLNSVLADLDGMVRRLAGADVVVETEIDPGLWYVLADPGQLEQVVINLVVNARDAMPDGGRIAVTTANRILLPDTLDRPAGVRPGAYVALALSDTGVGMDPELQSRIFEPFFTTKEPGKGTGLGLSTVYGIVKQSGGFVWAYSEVGLGSTFKVYLPVAGARDATVEPAEAAPSPTRGSETIVVVEDEEVVRELLTRTLRNYGYRVLEAADGLAALQLIRDGAGPIELVVTDVVMPTMGGQELSDALASIWPDVPVLYISGFAGADVISRGLLRPGAPLLEKPFSPETLLEKVRELLDRRASSAGATSAAPVP
jgi:CheY-like chemotaxis protein